MKKITEILSVIFFQFLTQIFNWVVYSKFYIRLKYYKINAAPSVPPDSTDAPPASIPTAIFSLTK